MNNKGKNNPNYGKKWNEEQRRKARERAIEQWQTPEFRERMTGKNNPMYGKHHLKKTRDKMSESHEGKSFSKKHRDNISKALTGIKRSKETKEKNSKTMKKVWKRPGYKEKMSGETAPRFRKEFSPKTIEKMSKSNSGENNGFYNKTHTLESIEKIKESRAKQICPVKDTKIEVKIQGLLRQLGYDFFTHQYMKIEHGYQCDILIPSLNLVVEADGDYWHKYPTGREIDHIRTKELTEKGFKVLRLWEREINNINLKGFEDIITKIK